MKIYTIIADRTANLGIIYNRIKTLGDNYTFWENHWLLASDLQAKEIYQKIKSDDLENTSFLVVEFETSNYFGRMKTSLWEWLKSHKGS